MIYADEPIVLCVFYVYNIKIDVLTFIIILYTAVRARECIAQISVHIF